MAEKRIRGVRLTREKRLEVRQLISTGSSFADAAAAARCSTKTVQKVVEFGWGDAVASRSPCRAAAVVR